MKKIIFFFLLFSTTLFSQKIAFDYTVKSNYTFIGFEDGLASYQIHHSLGGAIGTSQTREFTRFAKGNFGLELGMRAKYFLFENVSFNSGLEMSLINFNKSEELKDGQTVESLFIPVGQTEITPTIFGVPQPAVRDENGDVVVFNGTTGEAYRQTGWNQKIIHLTIPFNLGFTSPSKKWSAYGGFWYSRLILSKYEGHDFIHHIKSNNFFNKNVFGVNVGFDIKIYKRMGFTFNYSSGGTDLYATENPIEDFLSTLPQQQSFHLLSAGVVFNGF